MAVANPNQAPPIIVRAIQQQLLSVQSLQRSYVSFVNTTQRIVNLYWLNYQGVATFYLQLSPLASAKVNTYRSHPWIFRDRESGERMHVRHSEVFWPQPYHAPDPRNRGQWITCRKEILIHFPVRTLRETCLWQVLKSLIIQKTDTDTEAPEQGIEGESCTTASEITTIDNICLPSTIKTDLKQLFTVITKHRITNSGNTTR